MTDTQLQNLLEVRDLCLVRGWRILVDGLSFDVAPGQAIALRGPNGSGKTTLLRALAGLHVPRTGTIKASGTTDGEDIGRHVGYLGHQDAVKPGQSVRAQLAFWAAVGGSGWPIDPVLQGVGLARQADLPGSALSAGQRRRFSLARLQVLCRPIWLLDEPAAPLDREGRDLLDGLIEDHRATGGIVIVAVHGEAPTGNMRDLDLTPGQGFSLEPAL
jgi:heme exporter protein A